MTRLAALGLTSVVVLGSACVFLETDYDYALSGGNGGAGGMSSTTAMGGDSSGGGGVGGMAVGGMGGSGGTAPIPCEGFMPTPVSTATECQEAFVANTPLLHFRADDLIGYNDTEDVLEWCGRGTSPEPFLAPDAARAPRYDADGVSLLGGNTGFANGALEFSLGAKSYMKRRLPFPKENWTISILVDAPVGTASTTILRWGNDSSGGPILRVGFRGGVAFLEYKNQFDEVMLDAQQQGAMPPAGNTVLLTFHGTFNGTQWFYDLHGAQENSGRQYVELLTPVQIDLGAADDLVLGARSESGLESIGGKVAEILVATSVGDVYQPVDGRGCFYLRYGLTP